MSEYHTTAKYKKSVPEIIEDLECENDSDRIVLRKELDNQFFIEKNKRKASCVTNYMTLNEKRMT